MIRKIDDYRYGHFLGNTIVSFLEQNQSEKLFQSLLRQLEVLGYLSQKQEKLVIDIMKERGISIG
tara:strand:- start:227 stop:421 length:195 start_codon:yes stop_codon:yes gene_type:complete